MRATTLALALSTVPCLMAAPADSALSGTWRITNAAPTKGKLPELGELKVDAGGNYQWSENRQLAGLGMLQPHRPASGPARARTAGSSTGARATTTPSGTGTRWRSMTPPRTP